jgi:hypothetical protein
MTTLSAFGEVLIAPITPMAGWKFAYNINADMIKTTLTGSGTVTQSGGKAVLSTTAATNSSAKIETYLPIRYIPGMGGLARFTAVFSTGVAGSTQIIGVGDASDGLFFGFNGATFGTLRRCGGTDYWTASDAWVSQYSGFDRLRSSFDPSSGQVFQIQYQWLGFGNIRYYIEDAITGRLEEVHNIRYAGAETVTSFLNPTLPIMAMVENTTNNTGIVLSTPSAMGGVEGFVDNPPPPNPFALKRQVFNAKTGVSAETNIVTLKNLTTWQGIANRIYAQPSVLSVSVDGTKNATMRITRNATLGGTPSYTNFNASTSPMQYDTAGNTVTGGTIVFAAVLSKASSHQFELDRIGFEIIPGETYTFSVTSSAATDVSMAVLWSDLH